MTDRMTELPIPLLARCVACAALLLCAGAWSQTEPAAEPPAAAAASVAEPADDAASAPVGQPHRHQRAHQPNRLDARLAQLSADLRLDAAQRSAIRPLLEKQEQEMTAVRRQPGLTPAERSRRLQLVADRSVEQIRARLDDEQRRQYIQPVVQKVAARPPRSTPAGTPR